MIAPETALPGIGALDPEAAALVAVLQHELAAGLGAFWAAAQELVEGSGVRLLPPAPAAYSLEQNFFSFLFLYSYHRAGLPRERRVVYAGVNQCLRGMVTGCDNLLDDEYKETLATDLPAGARRFRSVLDIMVSDRVLFELLARELGADAARAGSAASLRALTPSGAQEASEEGGVACGALPPQAVLANVHHYKTGLLFRAPWAVPSALEPELGGRAAAVEEALYRIGMGCQLLDDLVDLAHDLRLGRHNYVASLAWHGADPGEREALRRWQADGPPPGEAPLALALPVARQGAVAAALGQVWRGARQLFPEPDGGLAELTVAFLVRRIGAEPLVR